MKPVEKINAERQKTAADSKTGSKVYTHIPKDKTCEKTRFLNVLCDVMKEKKSDKK